MAIACSRSWNKQSPSCLGQLICFAISQTTSNPTTTRPPFLDALEHKQTQLADTHPSILPASAVASPVLYIQKLELQGRFNLRHAIPPLIPYLKSLTHLLIRHNCSGPFSLTRLLFICPLLESLRIEPTQPIRMSDVCDGNLSSPDIHECPQLRLRKLVLRRIQVAQFCIETILSKSPLLQVPKLELTQVAPGLPLWSHTSFVMHL